MHSSSARPNEPELAGYKPPKDQVHNAPICSALRVVIVWPRHCHPSLATMSCLGSSPFFTELPREVLEGSGGDRCQMRAHKGAGMKVFDRWHGHHSPHLGPIFGRE